MELMFENGTYIPRGTRMLKNNEGNESCRKSCHSKGTGHWFCLLNINISTRPLGVCAVISRPLCVHPSSVLWIPFDWQLCFLLTHHAWEVAARRDLRMSISARGRERRFNKSYRVRWTAETQWLIDVLMKTDWVCAAHADACTTLQQRAFLLSVNLCLTCLPSLSLTHTHALSVCVSQSVNRSVNKSVSQCLA
jgi:hypothetical protein